MTDEKELETVPDSELVKTRWDKDHPAAMPVVQPGLPATVGPMEIMMEAVQRNQGKEVLEQLQGMFEFQKKIDAENARKAYHKAMAEFKANPPVILKTAQVRYQKKDKSWTEYDHAVLGEIAEGINTGMAGFQLYPRWDMTQPEGKVAVTCIVTHELGHSETYGPISASPDASGGKNEIQAISSTNSYLERISLLGITGLAAKGMDDDGKPPGGKADKGPEFITKDQVEEITKRLKAVWGDNISGFLEWLEAETVETILAKDYGEAIGGIVTGENAKAEAEKANRDEGNLSE